MSAVDAVCAGDTPDVFAGAVEVAGDVDLFHPDLEGGDDRGGLVGGEAFAFGGQLAESCPGLGWGHTQMMPHEVAYGYCKANEVGLQWWLNRIADQEVLMGDTSWRNRSDSREG